MQLIKTHPRGLVTVAQWLQAQGGVNIRKGHKLPLLSAYGYEPFYRIDAAKVLADMYGHAVHMPYIGVSPATVQQFPENMAAIALCQTDPDKYKLRVKVSNIHNNSREDYYMHRADGARVSNDMSPAVPDSWVQEFGDTARSALGYIRAEAPIAILQNEGERGLDMYKDNPDAKFGQDPAVLAAKGTMSWWEYISKSKARIDYAIMEAVQDTVPDRQAYVNYTMAGNFRRKGWYGWQSYDWDYLYTRTTTDYANTSTYYGQFNTGWTGQCKPETPGYPDMLSGFMNSKTYQLSLGEPYDYSFWSAGWVAADNDLGFCPDMEYYKGFLKCCMVAGSLGGICTYFTRTDNIAPFDYSSPPHWLEQIVALSEVYAVFTHLDDYIFQGDLQTGQYTHGYSEDLPSYELDPVAEGTLTDLPSTLRGRMSINAARVLSRKIRGSDKWLLVAWAPDGVEKEVSVEVPSYGRARLTANKSGILYTISGQGFAPVRVQELY